MDRIDKDVGINALRQVRENIEEAVATASQELVQYRHTVQAQAARIAELEQAVAIQEDIATDTTAERDAQLMQACARVDELEHEVRQVQEVEQQAYRAIDRLTERCSELVEERDIFSNQAEEFQKRMGEYRDACEQYEEKIEQLKNDNLARHREVGRLKARYQDEARAHNVMRLAAAADHHLQHGRAAIARCYLTPLMEGKHDANGYDETVDDRREVRPHDSTQTVKPDIWRAPEGRITTFSPFGWDVAYTSTD